MQNHLAEEVLYNEMLHLMLQLVVLGQQEQCIELLKGSSRLIQLFHDTRPIRLINDERLVKLKSISDWFEKMV